MSLLITTDLFTNPPVLESFPTKKPSANLKLTLRKTPSKPITIEKPSSVKSSTSSSSRTKAGRKEEAGHKKTTIPSTSSIASTKIRLEKPTKPRSRTSSHEPPVARTNL
ncbi:hypothetical protein NHQ30_009933 [Ciborinia camelliae]|nr:hypothetical protein NHQ30_009933 [Ciborinia camelliae]